MTGKAEATAQANDLGSISPRMSRSNRGVHRTLMWMICAAMFFVYQSGLSEQFRWYLASASSSVEAKSGAATTKTPKPTATAAKPVAPPGQRPAPSAGRVNTAATYPFEITGLPAGSRVRIMNIKPTYTPKMPLPAGKYDIDITLPGGRNIRGWLTVDASHYVFSYGGK